MARTQIFVFVACLIGFISNGDTYATTVNDPISDFIEHSNLSAKDVIYKIEADLNEDGINDIFLSSSSDSHKSGRQGLSWVAYLTTKEGLMKSVFGITMSEQGGVLKRLPETRNRLAFLAYLHIAAGRGSVVAQYFDQSNKLHVFNFGEFNIHETTGNQADRNRVNRLLSGGKLHNVQKLSLEEILNSKEVKKYDSRKDDFYSQHNFVSDPNVPNRSLVYRKSDNKLVGYLDNGVKFTAINEKDREEFKAKRSFKQKP